MGLVTKLGADMAEAADPSAADALIEVAAGVQERLWVSERLWCV